MLYNFYVWLHANTPFHFWDIPAFVIAAIIIVVAIVHHRNQKKREKNFNDTMEQTLTGLNEVMTEAGVANAAEVIEQAAEAADIQGPKAMAKN
jgi:preprotein translocase subunit YajC